MAAEFIYGREFIFWESRQTLGEYITDPDHDMNVFSKTPPIEAEVNQVNQETEKDSQGGGGVDCRKN